MAGGGAAMMCKGKFVFSVFASFLILTALASVSAAKTIYVPDDYEKIQWAVDNASAGDTIIVRDGTYTENINVNKPHLTIRSENGADSTIVHAANPDDHVFEMTADYVNISGFTVKGATGKTPSYWPCCGIYLNNVQFCNISNSIFSGNNMGIHLEHSPNNSLIDNVVSNNSDGIWIAYLSNKTLLVN